MKNTSQNIKNSLFYMSYKVRKLVAERSVNIFPSWGLFQNRPTYYSQFDFQGITETTIGEDLFLMDRMLGFPLFEH